VKDSWTGPDELTWVTAALEHLGEGGAVGWVFLYDEDPAGPGELSLRRSGHPGAGSQGGVVLHLRAAGLSDDSDTHVPRAPAPAS
jgi:hypothetical protein